MLETKEDAILWLQEKGLYAVDHSKRLPGSIRASSPPVKGKFTPNSLWIHPVEEGWGIRICFTHENLTLEFDYPNLDAAVKDAYVKITNGTRNLLPHEPKLGSKSS